MPETYLSPLDEFLARLGKPNNPDQPPMFGGQSEFPARKLEWDPDANVAPSTNAPGSVGMGGGLPTPPLASEAKGGPVPFDYGAFNKSSVMGEATPPLFPRSGETFDGRQPISEFGQLFPYKGQLSQDEVAGYMKKNQERNVGSSPVPPVDTSKPIVEPSFRPTAAPSPSEQPTEEPTEPSPVSPPAPYDPNNVLLEQYRPAIMDLAMEARKRDLARMDNPLAMGAAYGFLSQGLATGDSVLTGKGADLLRESQFGPLYQPSLKSAGESAQQVVAGEKAAEAMDPNSPTSEAYRIAAMASPMMDDWASRATANGEFSNPTQAKTWMYRKLKGMHGAGIAGYLDTIIKGGDFTKQDADRKMVDAMRVKTGWESEQVRLAFQTQESLLKALQDPSHPVSRAGKAWLKMTMGPHWKPEFEGMNLLELSKMTDAVQPAIQLVQYQANQQMQTEREKVIIPGELEYNTQPANINGMTIFVNPGGANPQVDGKIYTQEQNVLNAALRVKEEAGFLAGIEGKMRVGQGTKLASALRTLEASLDAAGKGYGKDSPYGQLPGLLDRGEVEARSALTDVNALVDKSIADVTSSAKTNAGRFRRPDITIAEQNNNPMLIKNPVLGGAANATTSDVVGVKFEDRKNGIKSVPAWRQNINGKTHYWFYQNNVRRHVVLAPNESPSMFEVK